MWVYIKKKERKNGAAVGREEEYLKAWSRGRPDDPVLLRQWVQDRAEVVSYSSVIQFKLYKLTMHETVLSTVVILVCTFLWVTNICHLVVPNKNKGNSLRS